MSAPADPARPWRGACTLCAYTVHSATRAEAVLVLRQHVEAEHVLADVWEVPDGEESGR